GRPVVAIDPFARRPVLEHAGQRRQPRVSDVTPRIKGRLDIHDDRGARLDAETIGASRRWTIEQRMDNQFRRARFRLLDPYAAEEHEFLAGRLADVDGEAAGGQPVRFAPANRPEIARTLEDGILIEDVRAVDRPVDTESREAERCSLRRVSDRWADREEGAVG